MATPLKFVMTPVGSSGDVHPFIGIGRALRGRGHEVVVINPENFRSAVESAGLGFHAFPDTSEAFDAVTRDPDIWHPRRGVELVFRVIARYMREAYDHIAACYEPGRTVLVRHPLSIAGRVFEETRQAPGVTLNLAPSSFRTLHGVPSFVPGKDFSRLPRWVKRLMWWSIDRFVVDRPIIKPLNDWRKQLGLEPVRRIFNGWVFSPDQVIALFPNWFAPAQPDWPPQTRLTGFPLFDETGQHEIDAELDAFLDRCPRPVVFTPGSANCQAGPFFEAAVGAAKNLHHPVLLLTRYHEQLPRGLPDNVLHRTYAPFSQVFPRCAAVVHHGGIGTCAQGLAAGVPQLIMPMGFDQPDNATRLWRVGVGAWLTPKRFTADRVRDAIHRLVGSPDIAEACRGCAQRIRKQSTVEETCDLIEAVAADRP